jgi:NADH-quinone oxidoreductase subunit E
MPVALPVKTTLSEINKILSDEAMGEGSLIGALEEIQAQFRYLPPEALILASEYFNVPLAQTYAVATFYNAFSLKPKGKHCLHVCMGTACHVRGSPQVLERLETKLNIKAGETTADRRITLETVNCLGACALGPIVVTDEAYSGAMTLQKVDQLLRNLHHMEEA